MNKKGFTLVEVLAILIIIGLVFAILTPAVSHIIEEAKNKADLRSAEAHVEAAKYYFNRFQTEDDLSIDGNLLEDINVAHKAEEGSINIDNDGNIRMAIVIRNKCYRKTFDSNDITIDNDIEDCTFYTDSKCFAYKTSKNGITITDYLCDGTHEGLEQITDVVIPRKINNDIVTYIADGAFESKGLTSFKLPSSVWGIGFFAFNNNNLASAYLSDNIRSLGSWAFSNNKLNSIRISNNIEFINNGVYQNNNLENVAIPDNIDTIAQSAFSNNKLKSIKLPSKIKYIGGFDNNLITSVIIPKSAINIMWDAFDDNVELTFEDTNNWNIENDNRETITENVVINNPATLRDLLSHAQYLVRHD